MILFHKQQVSKCNTVLVLFFACILIFGCTSGSKKAPSDKLMDKAGKINELVNYKRYEDLYTVLTESLRLKLTLNLFNSVDSTIKSAVGEYVKPLDTTITTVNGIDLYTIRNQHQKGIRTTTVQFDGENKVLHLFSIPSHN